MSVPASLPELIRRLLARLIPGTRAVPCPVPVPRSSQNTRRTLRSLLLLLHVLTLGSVAPLPAQDNLFTEKIAPLLQQHCISCHGPDAQESGLRLDSLQALNTGGKAGAPIIPGKPDESLLMVAVRRTDSALQMPPEGKLPAEAVAALEQWISQGAHHPDGPVVPAQPTLPFQPEQARQFWAFRPLQPPQTSAQPDSHPIDVLTARLLQQQGFVRNAPADRITIADIVTFIGLDFGRMIKFQLPPEMTNVARWADAMRARPAAAAVRTLVPLRRQKKNQKRTRLNSKAIS